MDYVEPYGINSKGYVELCPIESMSQYYTELNSRVSRFKKHLAYSRGSWEQMPNFFWFCVPYGLLTNACLLPHTGVLEMTRNYGHGTHLEVAVEPERISRHKLRAKHITELKAKYWDKQVTLWEKHISHYG